jgi:two-component system response regulator AtoC
MRAGESDGSERRRYPRAKIELPVQFYEHGGRRGVATGKSLNISPVGLLAVLNDADLLPATGLVDVHVGLPSEAPEGPADLFSCQVRRLEPGEGVLCALEVVGEPPPFLFAPEMVGRDPGIVSVKADLLKIADYDINVLIRGETGTGKNILAELIHRYSRRRGGPFIRVNCPSIPPSLIESELFGHERGAFTDARTSRPGLFRLAHTGTIVLDEISAIPPSLQVKLLQAIEEKRFIPVGASGPVNVDVRIVSITNEELPVLMREGRFRRDLYHRLSEAPMALPPLRERRGDIPLLVDYFVRRYSAEFGKPYQPVGAPGVKLFQEYAWPGNVRELANCIKYGVLRGDLRLGEAGPSPDDGPRGPQALAGVGPHAEVRTMREAREAAIAEAERLAILRALEASRRNRTRAAKQLGVSYRTLLRKINRYGIRD